MPFEQHLAEARQADPAPVGGGGPIPVYLQKTGILSTERSLSMRLRKPQPNTAAAPFTFVGNTAMLLPLPELIGANHLVTLHF